MRRVQSPVQSVLVQRRQAGFVHILLLIFVILGLSVWGVSTLSQRVETKQQEEFIRSNANATEAVDELVNYALNPPAESSLEHEEQASYNVYSGSHVRGDSARNTSFPFRYFSLPCPDVTGFDSNLDGVSDFEPFFCSGPQGNIRPLAQGSRFGNFPWRNEFSLEGTAGNVGQETTYVSKYIRGVGDDVTLLDGSGSRFWYFVSDNLIDKTAINRLSGAPLNPHLLMRQNDGWITVKSGAGDVLSNRVAAVVISPGETGTSANARIQVELLEGRSTDNKGVFIPPTAITNPSFYDAYLEQSSYGAPLSGTEEITALARTPDNGYIDQIDYLTIEELAGDDGPGIKRIEASGSRSIYDVPEGVNDSSGVVRLLEAHLDRFGFLPDPAMLDSRSAVSRERQPGPPAQSVITVGYNVPTYPENVVTTEITMTSSAVPPVVTTMTTFTTMTMTVLVRDESELPIQSGARIRSVPLASVSLFVRVADLPPVYFAAPADISLVYTPAILHTVSGASGPDVLSLPPLSIFPYSNGLANLDSILNAFPISNDQRASLLADGHHPGIDGQFGLAGFGSAGSPFEINTVAVSSDVDIFGAVAIGSVAGVLSVVISEPVYGYLKADSMAGIMSYPDSRDDALIDNLPPYSAKVLLPAGTLLSINVSAVTVSFPRSYAQSATFDRLTGLWIIKDIQAVAIDISAPANVFVTLSSLPAGLVMESGDFGFLPIDTGVQTRDFWGYGAGSNAVLSLSEEHISISDLSVELPIYVHSELIIVPLPPPGLIALNASPLPKPIVVPAQSEMKLPLDTRIIYRRGATIGIEEEFSIPQDSVVHLPAGSTLTVLVPDGYVSSGGHQMGNAVSMTIEITLAAGGFIKGIGGNDKVSPILFGNSGSGKARHFNIEMRGAGALSRNLPGIAGVTVEFSESSIFWPVSSKGFEGSPIITLAADAVLSADSVVPARFLTYPRRFLLLDPDQNFPASFNRVALNTLNAGAEIDDLVGLVAPNTRETLTNLTINVDFSEETQFLLPPNFQLSMNNLQNFVTPSEALTLSPVIVIPAGSGFFEPVKASILATMTATSGEIYFSFELGSDMTVNLAGTVQAMYAVVSISLSVALGGAMTATITTTTTTTVERGIIKNHLALFPETDMYVFSGGTVTLIPAGSIVDLLEGKVHLPSGLQKIQRVADDLNLISSGDSYIYFDAPVTLAYGYNDFEVTGFLNDPLPSVNIVNQVNTMSFDTTFSSFSVSNFIQNNGEVTAQVADPADPGAARYLALGAGSFIIIPKGNPIDFLSKSTEPPGASAEQSDYALLPPSAFAVVREDARFVVGAVTVTVLSSATNELTYIDLGSDNIDARRYALVDHPDYLSGDPVLFLSEAGYLVEENVVDATHSRNFRVKIPYRSRLDLYGNLERRADIGINADFLPVNEATFYRDFPLLYAVAPECRRGSSFNRNCAEGDDEGLVFSVEAKEEIKLTEEMIAPDAFLMTAYMPGVGNNVSLVVETTKLGALRPVSTITVAAIEVDATGVTRFLPSSHGFAIEHDRIAVHVDSTSERAEMRTYFGATVGASIDDLHYVSSSSTETLTVYVGGYVGDSYGAATGILDINVGQTITIGAGTKLGNAVVADRKIFGADTFATVHLPGGQILTLDLSPYVVADLQSFSLALSLSADTRNIDFLGNIVFDGKMGQQINVEGAVFSAPVIGMTANLKGYQYIPPIVVTAGTEIMMEPGYLWQGYIPRSVTMAVSRHIETAGPDLEAIRGKEALWRTYGDVHQPRNLFNGRVALRVQSTVADLNLWGTGLERPEGMDGLANNISAQGAGIGIADNVTVTVKSGSTGYYDLGGYTEDLSPYNLPIFLHVSLGGASLYHSSAVYVPHTSHWVGTVGRQAFASGSMGIPVPGLVYPKIPGGSKFYGTPQFKVWRTGASPNLTVFTQVDKEAHPVTVAGQTDHPIVSRVITLSGNDNRFTVVLRTSGGYEVATGSHWYTLTYLRPRTALNHNPEGAWWLEPEIRVSNPRVLGIVPPGDHFITIALFQHKLNLDTALVRFYDNDFTEQGAAAGTVSFINPSSGAFNQGAANVLSPRHYDINVGLMGDKGRGGGTLGSNTEAGILGMSREVNASIKVAITDVQTGTMTVVNALWRPRFRDSTGNLRDGFLRSNRKASPFGGTGSLDHSYTQDQPEVFGGTNNPYASNADIPTISDFNSNTHQVRNSQFWAGRLVTAVAATDDREDATIDGISCGGVPVTVAFNPPHFQISAIEWIGHEEFFHHSVWPELVDIDGAFMADPVALLAQDRGAGFEPNPVARDPYRKLDYAGRDYVPQRISVSVAMVSPRLSTAITLTTFAGMAFYIDPAYNVDPIFVGAIYPNDTRMYYSGSHNWPPNLGDAPMANTGDVLNALAYAPGGVVYKNKTNWQNRLVFGDDFRIVGPGALVPPFGAAFREVNADLLALRSNLATALLGTPPLTELYSDLTGDCVGTDDCAALYNNPYWFPIVGGTFTFSGVQIAFDSAPAPESLADNVRLIMPQPEALITLASSEVVTIHAGSIIYPRKNLIYPASALPKGRYSLFLAGSAVAALDVSPAFAPVPNKQGPRILGTGNIDADKAVDEPWQGEYFRVPYGNPMYSTHFNYAPVSVTAGANTCIVEPLAFDRVQMFDFSPYSAYSDNTNVPNVAKPPAGVDYNIWYTRFYHAKGGDDEGYPGAFSPSGLGLFGGVATDQKLISGLDGSFDSPLYGSPYQWDVETGLWTPSSRDERTYRFQNPYKSASFVTKIDPSRSRGVLLNEAGVTIITDYYSGGDVFSARNGFTPANVDNMYPDRNTDVPLGNPFSFRWFQGGNHFVPAGMERTGGFNQPWSLVGVNVTTTGDEFSALRLAHEIRLPFRSTMTISGYQGKDASPLPSSKDGLFTFPNGTEAKVLNVDAGSWVSSHPFVSRNWLGLEITVNGSKVVTVEADNDGYRSIDVSNKSVLHYMRSESQQGHYAPTSAVPLHTNVWIRLSRGGAALINIDTNEEVILPNNTLLNPILGTYIHLEPSLLAEGVIKKSETLGSGADFGSSFTNVYATRAETLKPLRLVRAALTIPVGSRVVVGTNGARIDRVKAATFFSIAPLEGVDCPYGELDLINGQSAATVRIDQIREGISDHVYQAATGQQINLAHPCAWLDDPENTDGDRFYVYRGRRRYVDDIYKVTTLSNDRTYLLGGNLTLL